MAMLCADEYPELDINKVIKMCLIHDFGEAITGDIPAFLKTAQNELDEDVAVTKLLSVLPADIQTELQSLFDEMNARETPEAKLFILVIWFDVSEETGESYVSGYFVE